MKRRLATWCAVRGLRARFTDRGDRAFPRWLRVARLLDSVATQEAIEQERAVPTRTIGWFQRRDPDTIARRRANGLAK